MSALRLVVILFAIFLTMGAGADWTDLLDKVPDSAKQAVTSSNVASATCLSQAEIVAGLKEALDTATAAAVSQLGNKEISPS